MLNYVEQPSFDLPAGSMMFDVTPEGRILAVGESQLWLENLPGSRIFTELTAPDFGKPTFARVSPLGTWLAIGNYERSEIYVSPFPPAGAVGLVRMAGTSFDAEWSDERRLFVTNQGSDGQAAPSIVTLVDVVTKSSVDIIVKIDGASAGVTIDSAKTLFTGNGFGDSDDQTGKIKGFKRSDWEAAVTSGTPLNFESSGFEVANLLSCYPLGFDGDGNLYVGGGNSSDGDQGYAAIVSRSGIRQALAGDGVITPTTAVLLQKLDPDPTEANNYWFVNSNPVRREIYLMDYGQEQVRVFRQRTRLCTATVNVHLGDTPNAFPSYPFVGMEYRTLLDLPASASFTGPMALRLETEEVQTLGGAQHQVTLNGEEVGRMTDGDRQDIDELFEFIIPRAQAESIIANGNPAELIVRVDGSVGIGFADDFIIRKIGTEVIPT